MKRSAQLASGQDGGARYVATKLKEFCDNHENVELHAVGHSAGSIFHAYFIPAALDLKVPAFKSVHLLAPAIRVDTFKTEIGGRIGNGVDKLTIFTMSKTYEQDDNCKGIYRKSLLYLIYHALERERRTPILGLEMSLRADQELKTLLGLSKPSASAEVIWSRSAAATGSSASRSVTHGGFDDDSATLGSVARRILNRSDSESIVEYVNTERGPRSADPWEDQVDWPEPIRAAPAAPALQVAKPAKQPLTPSGAQEPTLKKPTRMGRRAALCIGINQYPTAPLNGCVADARNWARTLKDIGFDAPALLLDRDATRKRVIEELEGLISSSRSGDVIVFQYAGHGTQLPDVSGDETTEDSPTLDEAICPVDFADGHFLIDDDIGAIFDRLPAGVNLTCFIDCCHSGTISRFAVGVGTVAAGADERPRFIVPTKDMKDAHRQFRQSLGRHRTLGPRGLSRMPEVVFSACLSTEVAWESGGNGDFTTGALRVLTNGTSGLSNQSFEERVIAAFGVAPRQHPRLYCQPVRKSQPLLQTMG